MKWFLACVLGQGLAYSEELRIGVGRSEVVAFKNLSRVAVSDGRKLRARAFPPGEVLLTGLKEGLVTLRLWSRDGAQRVFDVTVHKLLLTRSDVMVQVSLEFLEMNRAQGEALGLRPPDRIQFQGGSQWAGGQAFSGLNYSFQVTTPGAWIKMLRQSGWAKVLASPNLSVRLGEEATFHSGGEIPVSGEVESYGRVQRQVQWKPFGLTVKVRPESEDGAQFQSDIRLEMSEVGTGTRIEGVPPFSRRRLETKMSSQDRETVVLSGLIRQTEGQEDTGLPGLSDLPILGRGLFGSRDERGTTSEILMAMTVSLLGKTPIQQQRESFQERFDELGRGQR